MKYVLHSTTLGITLILFSAMQVVHCSGKREQRPVFITGTPVSLVPPAGFVQENSIGGFKHTSMTASIIAMEIPGPFREAAGELSAQRLKQQGMELLHKEYLILDSIHGILCSVSRLSQGQNIRQWMLLLPYGEGSVSITGTYLQNDTDKMEHVIKNALLTTKVSSVHDADTIPFQLKVKHLQQAKILTGPSVVFTENGKWNENSLQTMSFFAGMAMRPEAWGTEEIARSQFHELCSTCMLNESTLTRVNVDSLEGIELWGFTPGNKKLKYEMVLVDSSKFFLMVGTADSLQVSMLAEYRAAARTFARIRPTR